MSTCHTVQYRTVQNSTEIRVIQCSMTLLIKYEKTDGKKYLMEKKEYENLSYATLQIKIRCHTSVYIAPDAPGRILYMYVHM